MDVSRFLIVLGLVILAVGLLWPVLGKLGLGRLPGDIVIEREGGAFYFPIVTSLIISVVLSVILWLFAAEPYQKPVVKWMSQSGLISRIAANTTTGDV